MDVETILARFNSTLVVSYEFHERDFTAVRYEICTLVGTCVYVVSVVIAMPIFEEKYEKGVRGM